MMKSIRNTTIFRMQIIIILKLKASKLSRTNSFRAILEKEIAVNEEIEE